jgi:hypothetical protein
MWVGLGRSDRDSSIEPWRDLVRWHWAGEEEALKPDRTM